MKEKKISQTILGSNNNQIINVNMPLDDKHPLLSVIENIIKNIPNDPDFLGFIEELQNFKSERTIIGLEAKLAKANIKQCNSNTISMAVEQKEIFAKKLEKEQLSLVAQHCYVHILTLIKSLFAAKIRPFLNQENTFSDIESKIHSEIVQFIYQQTSGHFHDLNPDHIAGMLFYLTGKCHLSWEV